MVLKYSCVLFYLNQEIHAIDFQCVYLCPTDGLLSGGHPGLPPRGPGKLLDLLHPHSCEELSGFFVTPLLYEYISLTSLSCPPLKFRVLLGSQLSKYSKFGSEHICSLFWDLPMKGFPYCHPSPGDWPLCCLFSESLSRSSNLSNFIFHHYLHCIL